ncbi:hypothetical protein M422DRAFT_244310 [Sphaerobolus stellatus SS14]|nr:hypothetical protein M422DRAFT_244310 [Sphaerobolus stellatus SS14]
MERSQTAAWIEKQPPIIEDAIPASRSYLHNRPNQNISRIPLGLEDVIPPILLCRFMLQLRKFNSRVQTVPSIYIAPMYRGIRGQLYRLNETIIEEFGNPRLEFESEEESDMVEPGEDHIPSADIDTEVRITTEEFPWAVNSLESGYKAEQE